MKQNIITEEILAKHVLDTNTHVDGGWFWSKYSAPPYLGCQYGCTYCFLRDDDYGLNVRNEKTKTLEDPFSQFIRVRINAPEVLDRELSQAPKETIIVDDYQPLEKKFKLSREILKVCLKHKFPIVIVAKSPLVLRDTDLILKIQKAAWACVVISIGAASSRGFKEYFEPHASSLESRFLILKKLSAAGIYTGTALMHLLPFITETKEGMEAVVRKTKEHGGSFVLAGGLILSGSQATAFYSSLEKYNPELTNQYKNVYKGEYAPQDTSWARIGRTVKALCRKYGLQYRIKRHIVDSPLAVNKKLAEQIFLKVYEMELNETEQKDIERWRTLAWMIDELSEPLTKENIESILHQKGDIREILSIRKLL